jgi:DNA-binding SARP family transcriptional activator
VQFEVLGGVQVLRGGEPIELGGPLPRRLLAALLLDAPRPVTSETLIHRLWGDEPPATARTALQVHVSRLRHVLEPDRNDGEPWKVLSTVPSGWTT